MLRKDVTGNENLDSEPSSQQDMLGNPDLEKHCMLPLDYSCKFNFYMLFWMKFEINMADFMVQISVETTISILIPIYFSFYGLIQLH